MANQTMEAFTAPKVHDAVVGSLKDLVRGKLLDVGAGSGALSQKLSSLGFDVYSCDIEPNRFMAKTHFKKADLNRKIPYRDNAFDYVTCVEVIEHIENPWALVREFSRVLKRGGHIVITTPNILTYTSRLRYLFTGTHSHFTERAYTSTGHITPLAKDQLIRILDKNGFIMEKLDYNRGLFRIPLLFSFEIPIKNSIFGEILVIIARKK